VQMSVHVEPVIAGSRGFALALLAPLTERIGTRPRIAADAAHLRPFCTGPSGLVVVEFLGPDTLSALQSLLAELKSLRVVAAVPEKLAAVDASLRALGVEVARWDGTAAPVVGAVDRQLALAAAAAPPARPPAIAVPPSSNAAAPGPKPVPPLAAAAATRASVARAPVPAAQPAAIARGSDDVRPPPPRGQGSREWPLPPRGAEPAPAPAWPASVLAPMEAANALREALSGATPDPGSPLAFVAGVVANLSDLERGVLSGAPQPIDPEPIREAALMQVRVASALATAPSAGAPVDAAAVSALLADIDALLSRVSALAEGAPERTQLQLDVVRNALVCEAIDFSEAVQRASAAGVPPESAATRAARPSATRILSVDEEPDRARHRGIAVWIALGVALSLAGSYHGWRWYARGQVRAALTSGLPAGLTQIPSPPGGPRVLVRASTSQAPDPSELAQLRTMEEARGNVVRESDGMIFIEPAPRAAPQRPDGP
jgi:hypothetical protein